MSKHDKDQLVATINEEPASSPTTNRQINQAGQDATRDTNNAGSASQQGQQREQHDKGCGCGQSAQVRDKKRSDE